MTRILAAFCLALTVGCGNPTDAEHGISFYPGVSTPVLLPGDTLRVTVTILNARREPVTVEGNHCNMHFDVRDSSGILFLPAEAMFCLGVHIPVVLEPGETYTFDGFWSGRLSDSSGNVHFANPGTYRLRGRATLVGEARTVAGGHVTVALGAAAVP